MQSRRSSAAVRASGSPSMAQRQSGQLPDYSSYHHQPPPKAANANPSIEIEPSMSASFTNMNCESQNADNGNPLRFYPLEKRSNMVFPLLIQRAKERIYVFRDDRSFRRYMPKASSNKNGDHSRIFSSAHVR